MAVGQGDIGERHIARVHHAVAVGEHLPRLNIRGIVDGLVDGECRTLGRGHRFGGFCPVGVAGIKGHFAAFNACHVGDTAVVHIQLCGQIGRRADDTVERRQPAGWQGRARDRSDPVIRNRRRRRKGHVARVRHTVAVGDCLVRYRKARDIGCLDEAEGGLRIRPVDQQRSVIRHRVARVADRNGAGPHHVGQLAVIDVLLRHHIGECATAVLVSGREAGHVTRLAGHQIIGDGCGTQRDIAGVAYGHGKVDGLSDEAKAAVRFGDAQSLGHLDRRSVVLKGCRDRTGGCDGRAARRCACHGRRVHQALRIHVVLRDGVVAFAQQLLARAERCGQGHGRARIARPIKAAEAGQHWVTDVDPVHRGVTAVRGQDRIGDRVARARGVRPTGDGLGDGQRGVIDRRYGHSVRRRLHRLTAECRIGGGHVGYEATGLPLRHSVEVILGHRVGRGTRNRLTDLQLTARRCGAGHRCPVVRDGDGVGKGGRGRALRRVLDHIFIVDHVPNGGERRLERGFRN